MPRSVLQSGSCDSSDNFPGQLCVSGRKFWFSSTMAASQNDHTSSDSNVAGTTTIPGTPLPYDSEKLEQPKAEALPREITGWKWMVATVVILSSIFLYALDATIVADIQPAIVKEFDSLQNLLWLSVGFLMSATATNMDWGRIYSQFKSKWLYIFNVVIFEVGSALCGAAPNINAMIVGRVICGIGGSGLYIGVMTLIAVTTTMAERLMCVSATGLAWGLGIVLGPVIGGTFEESSVSWRWAFYINLFIGGAGAPAYFFLLPSKDPRPGVAYMQHAKEMDYIHGHQLGWYRLRLEFRTDHRPLRYHRSAFRSPGNSACLHNFHHRVSPHHSVQFFRSCTVLLLFATTAASASAAFTPIYFVPLFFQFTRNDGALDAGVRLLPLIVVLVVFIFVNGALMARFGYYMPWYTVGGLFAVAGGALMYTVDQSTSESSIYGYTVLIAVGVGLWIQASFSVAQAVVDPESVPLAIGFITLAQFLGNTVSLAIANSIFLNESQTKIQRILADVPISEIQAAVQGTTGGFLQSLGPDVRARVLDAIISSIDRTYILVITSGALVTVLSFFMRKEKLFINAGAAGA
ncbi:putative MFS drug efflux transporter [Pseudomassariella vexata]|uniref:Putative MFS drug efflux transporter n=1 Tax=Pseudomassariella vexata TaxID=1141098 RepID=A0A1Y2EFS5_9PEZI|nr:putative MFS drug efflux transporter [Pseudomassariella vexata]ORY70428.1 putative MFS drug efflux transporter [Pseudomassariella vexata]